MRVHAAQETDLKEIAVLWKKYLPAVWTLSMIEDSFGAPGVYTLVAHLNREIVGFLMGCSEGHAELYAIGVAEENRKQGVGNLLLENFFGVLRLKKISSLFLEVADSNKGARAFYEKNGFCQIAVRDKYYTTKNEEGQLVTANALVLKKTF